MWDFSFNKCYQFWEVVICFTLLPAMNSSYSTCPSTFVICLFHFIHSGKCVMILHLWFTFAIPWWHDIEPFHSVYWPFVYPLLWSIILVFLYQMDHLLTDFSLFSGYEPFVSFRIVNIFFISLAYFSHSLDVFWGICIFNLIYSIVLILSFKDSAFYLPVKSFLPFSNVCVSYILELCCFAFHI